jgi:hypothetical protein
MATGNPRSFIVVLGVWMLFGSMLLGGVALCTEGLRDGLPGNALGGILFELAVIAVSAILILKTTLNYHRVKAAAQTRHAEVRG